MNSIATNLHTKIIAIDYKYLLIHFPINIGNCFQFVFDNFNDKVFSSKIFLIFSWEKKPLKDRVKLCILK